ncbi:hypothetical protein Pelo_15736 [Pelomyxa schiedti]|nr:hypothetical protein Pelo_15736 [Pelomyxa schiedti]
MSTAEQPTQRTTIEPIVDARSQFVAFASSWIERCGAGSAAKSLSHNRALCESFGRDWVVGCCRQVGSTITIPTRQEVDYYSEYMCPPTTNVHVFIGLSATLGVVWCRRIGDSKPACSLSGFIIRGRVGDDRFVASGSYSRASVLVDSKGNVVSPLEHMGHSAGNWTSNGKWLVKICVGEGFVVWRMSKNGVPVSPRGVSVKCTLKIGEIGARFSQFDDPCGDVLVAVGDDHGSPSILFVDLENSCAAGVVVKARESILLPFPEPFYLFWSSPTTILTVHCAHDGCYRVCDAATGNQMHTFPDSFYLFHFSSEHIVWRKDVTTTEVYRASSDLSKPLCQYKYSPEENTDFGSSSGDVYTVKWQSPPSQHVVTALVKDTITGAPLALLREAQH